MIVHPQRSDFRRMMKQGRWRALRNIPVGWALQAIHSTDRSERAFRIGLELLLVMPAAKLLALTGLFQATMELLFFAFLGTHTLLWFATGNFWVYALDSFNFVRNPGIDRVLQFISLVQRLFIRTDCCDAVLIYGSMSRRQFHNRSDLDLRVLRRRHWRGFLAFPIAVLVRTYSFFLRLPVDLQVVDSMTFLERQMRPDEKPIVVYQRSGVVVGETGLTVEAVRANPSSVLRDRPAA